MRENLSSLDENFWHIDSKYNSQNVSLIYILEQAADFSKIESLLKNHLEFFPLKKKKVSQTNNSNLSWQTHANFSLEQHIKVINDSTGKEINKIAGEILSNEINKGIPPWEVIIINSPNANNEKHAIMFFWHHALCDGVGYVEFVESMCSKTPEGEALLQSMLKRKKRYTERENKKESIVSHLFESGIKLFNDLFRKKIDSPFNGKNSQTREIAFLDLALNQVNESRKKLSASLYEYMLSLTTIAAKNYMLEQNFAPKDLRVIIPVNMREKKESLNLSNYISGASLMLPLEENDHLKALGKIQKQLGTIKSTYAYKILAACNAKLPSTLQRMLAEFAAKKTNFICSTAPGSIKDRFISGIKINKIYGTPALMKDQGLSFGYMRCQEKVTVTLTYDPSIIQNPLLLLEELKKAHYSLL